MGVSERLPRVRRVSPYRVDRNHYNSRHFVEEGPREKSAQPEALLANGPYYRGEHDILPHTGSVNA